MKIELTIPGEVVPTQSVRARIVTKTKAFYAAAQGNTLSEIIKMIPRFQFIQFYQPKKIKDYKETVIKHVWTVLPKGFTPLTGPLRLVIIAGFSPPASMSKRLLDILDSGGEVYKHTKPDIMDNISKGVIDALEGLVFVNDSQISIGASKKIYTRKPYVYISVEELPDHKGGTLYG